MPNRMFVTVDYEEMAQANPTGRLPLNQLNCCISLKAKAAVFLATGFIDRITPMWLRPNISSTTLLKNGSSLRAVNDWNDMPATAIYSVKLTNMESIGFPIIKKECGLDTLPPSHSLMSS